MATRAAAASRGDGKRELVIGRQKAWKRMSVPLGPDQNSTVSRWQWVQTSELCETFAERAKKRPKLEPITNPDITPLPTRPLSEAAIMEARILKERAAAAAYAQAQPRTTDMPAQYVSTPGVAQPVNMPGGTGTFPIRSAAPQHVGGTAMPAAAPTLQTALPATRLGAVSGAMPGGAAAPVAAQAADLAAGAAQRQPHIAIGAAAGLGSATRSSIVLKRPGAPAPQAPTSASAPTGPGVAAAAAAGAQPHAAAPSGAAASESAAPRTQTGGGPSPVKPTVKITGTKSPAIAAGATEDAVEKKASVKPKFTFGGGSTAAASGSEQIAKPAAPAAAPKFTFGGGGGASSAPAQAPTFTFGGSAGVEKKPAEKPVDKKPEEKKSLQFTFGQ